MHTATAQLNQTARSTSLAPSRPAGVIVQEENYGTSYTGSAEALIAAGIVRADQLPGAPGVGKTMANYQDGKLRSSHPDPTSNGPITRIKRNKKSFRVWVESAEKRAEAFAKLEAKARLREAVASEQRQLSSLPGSHAEFKRRSVEIFESCIGVISACCLEARDRHGYSYSRDDINAFELQVQLMRGVLEAGTTVFSAQRHRAAIITIKAATAQHDHVLQGALAVASVAAK